MNKIEEREREREREKKNLGRFRFFETINRIWQNAIKYSLVLNR
jgi:hypothetical protein